MIIQTPRLCNDVAFLPPRKDSPNKISCSPIIPQVDVDDYEKRIQEESSNPPDLGLPLENPFGPGQSKAPPNVGGIILGANKWVPVDSKIEKSAIVGGGGKESYVETIADSTGKLLTAEQLKKMNLGDVKDVEKLKKELEKIAGGQQWKLEVFDTPQGREYRGVLLGDEDPREDDKKQQEQMQRKDLTPKKADGDGGDGDQGAEEESENKGSEETYKDEL